jgi:hypothetical protein
VSTESQDLLNFVAQLPEGFAYAPIYVKGFQAPVREGQQGQDPAGEVAPRRDDAS